MTLKVQVRKQRGDFLLDADFQAPTPGVVALFGRSGSGKSTLVNLIAGLDRPDAGAIRLDDEILYDAARGIDIPAERRRIGYVFQDARLFPHLSVASNLDYGAHRTRAERLITREAVCDLLALGPLLKRRVHGLSGGERQRLAVGRALLSQPRLLLLDEPLASLDAARREEVLPYLEVLRDQLSIPMVYVSHDFDEVWRLATHLVLIENGRTVAQGSVADMSLHPGLRAIVGPEALGAIVEGEVLGCDESGLMRLKVGRSELKIEPVAGAEKMLRVQLLARDIIIATQEPAHLSVRNALKGSVANIAADDESSDLIGFDIGGATIVSRITRAATRELALKPGMPVWALVKSVSLRRQARAHA
jgi:molybdate transport system ATP-binding protein